MTEIAQNLFFPPTYPIGKIQRNKIETPIGLIPIDQFINHINHRYATQTKTPLKKSDQDQLNKMENMIKEGFNQIRANINNYIENQELVLMSHIHQISGAESLQKENKANQEYVEKLRGKCISTLKHKDIQILVKYYFQDDSSIVIPPQFSTIKTKIQEFSRGMGSFHSEIKTMVDLLYGDLNTVFQNSQVKIMELVEQQEKEIDSKLKLLEIKRKQEQKYQEILNNLALKQGESRKIMDQLQYVKVINQKNMKFDLQQKNMKFDMQVVRLGSNAKVGDPVRVTIRTCTQEEKEKLNFSFQIRPNRTVSTEGISRSQVQKKQNETVQGDKNDFSETLMTTQYSNKPFMQTQYSQPRQDKPYRSTLFRNFNFGYCKPTKTQNETLQDQSIPAPERLEYRRQRLNLEQDYFDYFDSELQLQSINLSQIRKEIETLEGQIKILQKDQNWRRNNFHPVEYRECFEYNIDSI